MVVFVIRALPLGVDIRAPDSWKLPKDPSEAGLALTAANPGILCATCGFSSASGPGIEDGSCEPLSKLLIRVLHRDYVGFLSESC